MGSCPKVQILFQLLIGSSLCNFEFYNKIKKSVTMAKKGADYTSLVTSLPVLMERDLALYTWIMFGDWVYFGAKLSLRQAAILF